jgi:hypothetical protein
MVYDVQGVAEINQFGKNLYRCRRISGTAVCTHL